MIGSLRLQVCKLKSGCSPKTQGFGRVWAPQLSNSCSSASWLGDSKYAEFFREFSWPSASLLSLWRAQVGFRIFPRNNWIIHSFPDLEYLRLNWPRASGYADTVCFLQAKGCHSQGDYREPGCREPQNLPRCQTWEVETDTICLGSEKKVAWFRVCPCTKCNRLGYTWYTIVYPIFEHTHQYRRHEKVNVP